MGILCYFDTNVYAAEISTFFEQDPQEVAEEGYLVETRSKKGIQEGFSYSNEYKDLGISHTQINVCLNELFDGDIAYDYKGKTYMFSLIPDLPPAAAKEFNENNVSITLVLLMKKSHNTMDLIYSGARGNTSKTFYAWEVYEEGALTKLSALLDFLAYNYGKEDCHIDNWVVGNEINMPNAWNYTGTTNVATNADIAAKSFLLVNKAIKRYNNQARAYISLDHSWGHNDEGRGIAGKVLLDAVAARIDELAPDTNWNLAFHLYSPIMTDSNIWNSRNANKYTVQSVYSDFISAKNLNILTDYIKENYGRDTRIILSEQGFTMYGGQLMQQAAALCYTYYAAEFNDMIDGTMFRSLKDAPEEMKDHFYFGLLNSDGTKRPSYDVFKYMDTDEWETYTKECLETIEIERWNDVVANFDGSKFDKEKLVSLMLEKDGTTIVRGYKEKLEYTVYPLFADTDNLYWFSEDESVVTVEPDTGILKGINPGRTYVYVENDGEVMDGIIVTVREEAECKVAIETMVSNMYLSVYGREIGADAKQSYTERLLNKSMTGARMAYEMIARRQSTNPTANSYEYVMMIYEAMLGLSKEELNNDKWQREIKEYELSIDAGMDGKRVIADMIMSDIFDYRCYECSIERGYPDDVEALSNIIMLSYNRNSKITYKVAYAFDTILHRVPTKDELMDYSGRLIAKKITNKEMIINLLESKEFEELGLSSEEIVTTIYKFSKYDNINTVVAKILSKALKNKEADIIQIVNLLIE